MVRPVIGAAFELLAGCDGAPGPDELEDLGRAWSGALRGVPDEAVLAAAGSWEGSAWPSLTEFLVHAGSRPAPAPRPVQEPLSRPLGRDEAKAKIAAARARLRGAARGGAA